MTEPRRLEAAFQRIAATRMHGMPMLNPALEVEAVAFRDWDGHAIGVLVTPWAINLVLLPQPAADVPALRLDQRACWRLPSGEYEFMGGNEPECGAFQFCSLFSPPVEFAAQAEARAVATAFMQLLFVAPETAPVSRRNLLALPPPGG